uniref:adenylate kinase n=1 Tax=Kalanchoe fedtschenkoi TaxID=63787 RepID=A0A7N1A1P1_KALFE
MLRAAVAAKTPLGVKAKEAVEKGELVSDDLVVGIIDEALKNSSYEMLEKRDIKFDKVKITGRWIHPSSGRSYHTKFAPPRTLGVDDVTGEPLIQRKDDTAAVLRSRLKVFHRQTKLGMVAQLHGEKPPKEVTSEVQKVLSS